MTWWKDIDWKEWMKDNIKIDSSKQPIILVEGVDASGKSTVIDILLEIIKHTFLLHTSAPLKGSQSEYYQRLLNKSIELIQMLNQPFIADRFHIGEAVYGSIFRKYELDYKEIDNKLLDMGAKQIYVMANKEVILERLKKRGDWYIKLENVEPIMNRYEKELKESKLPLYVLDTTRNIQAEDIKKLIKFIYS